MAANLFRSMNTRGMMIHIRTHFTKTPNHHTKAKWRPFRREKVLDVRRLIGNLQIPSVICFQIDLPDFDKERQLRSYNLQEQREYFRREGIPPVRTEEYKPLYIDASSKLIG